MEITACMVATQGGRGAFDGQSCGWKAVGRLNPATSTAAILSLQWLPAAPAVVLMVTAVPAASPLEPIVDSLEDAPVGIAAVPAFGNVGGIGN